MRCEDRCDVKIGRYLHIAKLDIAPDSFSDDVVCTKRKKKLT